MDTHNVPPKPKSSVEAGYEMTDARMAPIALAALGLTVIMILGLGTAWLLYRGLEIDVEDAQTAANQLTGDQTPPAPRLQTQPRAALEALRQREDSELNSYAWLDREHKAVRIPIDRAMELLAERGFPKIKPVTPEKKEPTP